MVINGVVDENPQLVVGMSVFTLHDKTLSYSSSHSLALFGPVEPTHDQMMMISTRTPCACLDKWRIFEDPMSVARRHHHLGRICPVLGWYVGCFQNKHDTRVHWDSVPILCPQECRQYVEQI